MNSAATFDAWLLRAIWRLSADSYEQVRSEIQDHFDSAREEALSSGAAPQEAIRIAVESLGNPRAAKLAYRKVILTAPRPRCFAYRDGKHARSAAIDR